MAHPPTGKPLLPSRHARPDEPVSRRHLIGRIGVLAGSATLGAWGVGLGTGAALVSPEAGAVPAGLRDPMRLGVDLSLMDSGLAKALQAAFARDTGVAVALMPDPAIDALAALERGERDAALTNAPAAEAGLEKQGLVHNRRLVARSHVVLVGPAAWRKTLDAGNDILLALTRIVARDLPFLSAIYGSGVHQAELELWKKAVTIPKGDRYVPSKIPGASPLGLLEQAQALQACVLLDRGVWLRSGGSGKGRGNGYAVLCEGDALLQLPVHVMRGFRSSHPATKLWANWISGPHGQSVLTSLGAYQAPK
jgi:tungstate transport system substrate-binding protein